MALADWEETATLLAVKVTVVLFERTGAVNKPAEIAPAVAVQVTAWFAPLATVAANCRVLPEEAVAAAGETATETFAQLRMKRDAWRAYVMCLATDPPFRPLASGYRRSGAPDTGRMTSNSTGLNVLEQWVLLFGSVLILGHYLLFWFRIL
jgi:hypothetical protein